MRIGAVAAAAIALALWTSFVVFGVLQFFQFKQLQQQVEIQGTGLKQAIQWINSQPGTTNAQSAVTATPSKH
jgi:hypothetical protein